MGRPEGDGADPSQRAAVGVLPATPGRHWPPRGCLAQPGRSDTFPSF